MNPDTLAQSAYIERSEPLPVRDSSTVVESITLHGQHWRLTQVKLADRTDRTNELVQECTWLAHPSETVELSGNLFVLDNLETRAGHIFIKCAALPSSRPVQQDYDLRLRPRKSGGFDIELLEPASADANRWTKLRYKGGHLERSRALQEWQRSLRPQTPSHQTARFISNTWGDRSRDSRIQSDFIEAEIDAAVEIGADAVQIDDGWQRGTTVNSSGASNGLGAWSDFRNADSRFWDVNPSRFPQGLEPLAARAKARGIGIGLWFAPDSSNEFAEWRRDAECVLGLHRTLGVELFKIDAVMATTPLASANLDRFFKRILHESKGRVVFDLDITDGARPGYFGSVEAGLVYVENRYTDFRSYWPHQTMRNLWKLSKWVDPLRLRMEFLNPLRNCEKYGNDPLAPSCYTPQALFATVMFSNPLGFFEASNLCAKFRNELGEMAKVWREHKGPLFNGTLVPVGSVPDGFSATGFLSLSHSSLSGYLLLFRGLKTAPQFQVRLKYLEGFDLHWQILSPEAGTSLRSTPDGVEVTIPKPLGFTFAYFSRK